MSIKYCIGIFVCITNAQPPRLIIHPHYSNRIIDNQYEWAINHNAALHFKDLCDATFFYSSVKIPPITYNKLSDFEKISFINVHNPTLCIILSCYHQTQPMPTIRLYQPSYGQNDNCTSSALSFIPYQYGYKKNYTTTRLLINEWYKTLSSISSLKILPCKQGPLKIGISIISPTIFVEIGIHSLEDFNTLLPTLSTTLLTSYQNWRLL